MRHRHDRHVDAGERADLLREHAARVDHDLRLDLALVGHDPRDPTALHRHPRDARVGVDLRTTAASAFGEGERELARVDVAVRRQVGGAQHALDAHGREQALRLVGGDQLERQPERLRPSRLARDLGHPLGRRREAQRADLTPARLEADLLLQRAVQVDRVHHHLRQCQRAAELADEAGRVERRAARQVGALHEHDVLPAEPGEPVQDRAAADATADHDRARTCLHPVHLRRFDDDARPVTAEAVARELERRAVVPVADALDEQQRRTRSDAERPRVGCPGGDRLEALHHTGGAPPVGVAHQLVQRAAEIEAAGCPGTGVRAARSARARAACPPRGALARRRPPARRARARARRPCRAARAPLPPTPPRRPLRGPAAGAPPRGRRCWPGGARPSAPARTFPRRGRPHVARARRARAHRAPAAPSCGSRRGPRPGRARPAGGCPAAASRRGSTPRAAP